MKRSFSNMKWAFVAIVLIGCIKDDEGTSGIYTNGVFIVNEGPFGSGTGTISFFDRTSKSVDHSIFSKINNRPLGNIVQSIDFYNGRGYIMVNNANKAEVVEEGTFKSVATIENLPLPRYFLPVGLTKGYISCWGEVQGEIKVIDLRDNTVSGTIPAGTGPEGMAKTGNKVFIVNGGGYGSDNRISVVDAETDEVIHTILVDDNPNSIKVDAQGKLWVMCGGKKVYDLNTWQIIPQESSKGALLQINPLDYQILKRMEFDDILDSPSKMAIDREGTVLFYLLGFGIYKFDIAGNQLPLEPFVSASFYGLGYDPATEYIYATDPGDYASAGKVLRYRADNGVPVDTFRAGIIPNGFCFD